MTDFASLKLSVDSRDIDKADKSLKGLTATGKKTEKSTDGMAAGFKRMLGPIAAVASAAAGLKKIVSVTREFDVLNAQLITATGGAENAEIAFRAIQEFAQQTPFDLQTTTKAFTQLVNLGLNPSQRAMTSYGDTASAMGKDIGQLVEAVADATTGEFERLKEFGIKTKTVGDNVTFTFRGMATTVGKNAAEIEEYLTKLGENNFAGAMKERMDTLDGAISTLGDSWDKLFLTIGRQDSDSVMAEIIQEATDAIEELDAAIASGQIEANIKAIIGQFDGFSEDFAFSLDAINSLLTTAFDGWEEDAGDLGESLSGAFSEMPENIRAFVQIMTIELITLVEKAKAFGSEIVDALNFGGDTFDFQAAIEKANIARLDSISIILEERDADVAATKERRSQAQSLREQYEKTIEARRKANEGVDVLSQFKIKPEITQSDSAEAKTKAELSAFARLQSSLLTEEEAIQESYNRRLDIILSNTKEGSRQQSDLKARLSDQFDRDILGEFSQPDTIDEEIGRLEESFAVKLDTIRRQYGEQSALEIELTQQKNQQIAILENDKNQLVLNNAETAFNGLAGLAKTFGGEQSKSYKALFATSQAFSIAKATMNMYTGISEGVKLGWPAMIPAIALAAGQGATAISGIRGQSFSGAYDSGGVIPSGSVGLVGEIGPELVRGPATVTSRRDTAALLEKSSGSDEKSGGTTIINLMDQKQLKSLIAQEMAKNNKVIVNTLNEEQRSRRF